jgi:Fe2+ or Zn2+ uptake regulation protein
MNNDIPEQADRTFQKYLRSVGMNRTEQRSIVLRVFFQTTKPHSAPELLYPVKQEDVNVSLATIYSILKLLVACGLAHETKSADGVARYTRDTSETCGHTHLVCKDCGALVDR